MDNVILFVIAGFGLVDACIVIAASVRIARSDYRFQRKVAQVLFALLLPFIGPMLVLYIHRDKWEQSRSYDNESAISPVDVYYGGHHRGGR